MSPDVIIAVTIAVPVALLTVFRIKATMVFLSLCLGSVLVQFMGADAITFVNDFFPHAGKMSESTVEIIMLLAPAILTCIFMFHSVSKSRLVLNVIPAITVGLLLVILLEPLLSPGLQGTITQSSTWGEFTKLESLILAVSALLNLVILWMEHRSHLAKDKKGKKG